jgi:Zn2+/Cd2+-exporting ATPase
VNEQEFYVGNMDCINCAKEVENGVLRLSGVEAVSVDFVAGKMRLVGDASYDTIKTRVEALGKTLTPLDSDNDMTTTPQHGGVRGFFDYLLTRRDTQLALAGGLLVILTLLGSVVGLLGATVTSVLYTAGMFITLWPILRSGVNSLLINRQFSINLLMTIAAVGAIIIGEYLESAFVIFLFAIGEALEGYTADRARRSIQSLVELKPATATRMRGILEEVVPVEELQIGDVILIRPGEAIPMDGRVRSGDSSVNQAPITGESIPVHKSANDEVFAGTFNGEGALTVEITRLAEDNTLNRIIQLVEEAQSVRAPSQRVIDRFASWYTPAVVVIAALVASVPPLLFGQPFLNTATETGWLYRALTMLVIACPCALVISTPVTIIAAITGAARRGVLIKGGTFLESLAKVDVIAFDKTGTLTTGNPAVTAVKGFDCRATAKAACCDSCDDVLSMASAVERRTSHPLARAVVEAAEVRGLAAKYPAAENVQTMTGRGVQGRVAEYTVTVGSHRYFEEELPHTAEICAQIDALEANGQTAILVARDNDVRGFITLADTPRADTRQVISELNALGLQTVMLTGDNAAVANTIAAQAGVKDVRASLLPAQKVEAVEALQAEGHTVAMIGDGINDTPALAMARVGIAMGGAGSPQALESADVALMADDLSQLPFVIRLARFTRRVIQQNVALSIGVKVLFLVLAFGAVTSMWAAILADVGMLLLVTLNGMRPLRNSL